MTKLKILAVPIFIFGLVIFLFGILLLVNVDQSIQLLENSQAAGRVQEIDLPTFRTILVTNSVLYSVVGLFSITSSVGLFFIKNWARRLWLAVLILIAGINLNSFISQFRNDTFGMEDFILYPVIGVVIAVMFLYFTREKTKKLFQKLA